MRALHADAVFTGDAAVIRDGAVVVGARGEIVDVGPAGDVLPRHAGADVERVHGVVLPGLVNAHTHLELSALRGQVPGGAGFVPWVEHLIGARGETRPEDDAEAIERAVQELDAFGTVGRRRSHQFPRRRTRARPAWDRRLYLPRGLRRRARAARAAGRGAAARCSKSASAPGPSAELEYAPSPHTLYTTHPAVVRRLVREARERGSRASLHLAEHAAERRFLEHGEGPIVAWYASRLKLSRESLQWPGKSPVAFADELGALAPHVLLVHLTDARPTSSRWSRGAARPGRLLPAVEPVHRDAPAPAPRRPRRGDLGGAGDGLARVERLARRARRGARARRPLP